ncbi:MAG: cytochrome P460 family protein [Deltaproteobacteria bacterium]|nr:cytochrome P460 family protein [Deltaproteobacteria bacterium]MBW2122386.1 cytochrome P460 family protein [Deltaproteobacteria bacterium]
MKKSLTAAVLVSVALVAFAALSGAGEEYASKFWTHITETDPYAGWGYWPGHYGIYPGKSPHGAYVKIYANGPALKAAREGRPMPDGAILVKENYGKDKKTLMAVTPMFKMKGYNSEAGDWWWAKYGPKGQAMASGKLKGCIDCHRVQQGNDWIFTPAR